MFERIIEEAPRFFTYYNLMFVLGAMWRTLLMTLVGCSIGFTVGLGLAVLRRTSSAWLRPARYAAILYVETFRRIPFLVVLFIVLYFIQPIYSGASLLAIATVAVCLMSTAFLSEIIRAGLESVPRQQMESAEVLNFHPGQTLAWVILPQAWKVILPPAVAFVVMFVKDTSLASQLGVVELTYAGKILVNKGFSPLLGFGAILAAYFILSYPLSRLGAHLETRLGTSRNT